MSSSTTDPHRDYGQNAPGAAAHHVDPLWLYLGVFAGLVVLTVVTVAASYFDFGAANTVIAVLIASLKALLVAVFFMHLRHDKRFNSLVFVSGLFFLSFLFIFTLTDTSTRNQVDPDHDRLVEDSPAYMAEHPDAAPAENAATPAATFAPASATPAPTGVGTDAVRAP